MEKYCHLTCQSIFLQMEHTNSTLWSFQNLNSFSTALLSRCGFKITIHLSIDASMYESVLTHSVFDSPILFILNVVTVITLFIN